MANFVRGEDFHPIAVTSDSRLGVHRHTCHPNKTLVLLIHGLGGSGYDTWGSLAKHIFNLPDHPYDVGVFDYLSGSRRLFARRSTAISRLADILVGEIGLLPYSNIVILAHSMGGILARTVVADLTGGSAVDLERIKGIMYISSPLKGSRLAPKMLLFKDARALHTNSSDRKRINEIFVQKIEGSLIAEPSPQYTRIPQFGMRGGADRVVRKKNAFFRLPEDQLLSVDGTHTSVVKIHSTASNAFTWIVQVLESVEQFHETSANRVVSLVVKPIVTQYMTNSGPPSLERAYVEACEQVRQESGWQISDIREFTIPVEPSLAIYAAVAGETNTALALPKLAEVCKLQVERPALSVGIAILGNATFMNAVLSVAGPHPGVGSRWIENISSPADLKDHCVDWLRTVRSWHALATERGVVSRGGSIDQTTWES